MGDPRRDAAEGGGGGIGGNFGSTLGSTKGALGSIPRTPLTDSNGGRLAPGGLRKLGKMPPTLIKSSSAAAALQGGGTALRRPIELARLASEGRLGNNVN